MKKLIVILVAIVVLAIAFALIDNIPTQASETYIQWFPMVYVNFRPARVGCELPDDANCNFGPPFSVPNLP
jgi:hypothetical protein